MYDVLWVIDDGRLWWVPVSEHFGSNGWVKKLDHNDVSDGYVRTMYQNGGQK
jgi:hypothetical protein